MLLVLKSHFVFLILIASFDCNKRYARKNNLPVFENVTLPRVGALHTIVNSLHPAKFSNCANHGDGNGKLNNWCEAILNHVKFTFSPPFLLDVCNSFNKKGKTLGWIIDATIGYPCGQKPDLMSIILMLGKPCDIYIYYRRFPIEEVCEFIFI